MELQYRKLKGRIVEKYGSQEELAKAWGITRQAVSKKMTGKTRFSTDDIVKLVNLLDIPKERIGEYFFDQEV